jgi:hypothetical protein
MNIFESCMEDEDDLDITPIPITFLTANSNLNKLQIMKSYVVLLWKKKIIELHGLSSPALFNLESVN